MATLVCVDFEAFLEAQHGMVWRMANWTTPTEPGSVEHATK